MSLKQVPTVDLIMELGRRPDFFGAIAFYPEGDPRDREQPKTLLGHPQGVLDIREVIQLLQAVLDQQKERLE